MKRFTLFLVFIITPIVLFAQTQYDYYEDGAVAGATGRALMGLLIILGIIGVFLIMALIGGFLNWIHPINNHEVKKEINNHSGSDKNSEKADGFSSEVKSMKEEPVVSQLIVKDDNKGNTSIKDEDQPKGLINNRESISKHESKELLKQASHLDLSEIELIINATDWEKQNRIKAEFKSGIPYYSSDQTKLIELWMYPLLPEERPFCEKKFSVLEGTETICNEAIKSDLIDTIELPSSLLYIGTNSIRCKNLKEILLPESLQYIGNYALDGCEKIKEIIIPSQVRFIGYEALPSKLERIEAHSTFFSTMKNGLYTKDLKRLVQYYGKESIYEVPEGVEDITGAFRSNLYIEKIILPGSLSSIGRNTFDSCINLKEIIIDKGIEMIDRYAFWHCKSLELIEIPEGVKTIGDYCFKDCVNLRYISLPSTLEDFEDDLEGCISLSKIIIPKGTMAHFSSIFNDDLLVEGSLEEFLRKEEKKRSEQPQIELSTRVLDNEIKDGWSDEFGVRYSRDGKKLLYSTERHGNSIYPSQLKEYKVKEGTVVICDNAFESGHLENIELPDSIEQIGHSAFSGCHKLRQINIPSGVYKIDGWAFYDCNELKIIDLPSKISCISSCTFRRCSSLQTLSIPQSIKRIESGAFECCGALRNILIPDGVEYIGEDAFHSCGIRKIDIPVTVKEIDGNPFSNWDNSIIVTNESPYYKIINNALYTSDGKTMISCLSNETTYKVLEGTEKIAGSAFSFKTKLERIILPLSLIEIGDNAFEHCYLTQIEIPNSVKHIGHNAFYECEYMTNIKLPDNLESLGGGAFMKCEKLNDMVLPESLVKIEKDTFNGCESIESIVINNPHIIIEEDAFSFMDNLQRIEFNGCPKISNDNIFYYCNSLKEILVPKGTKKKFVELLPSKKDIIIIKPDKSKNLKKSLFVLPTEITETDMEGSWKDNCDVIYTKDKKKLLTCEYKESIDEPFEDEFGTKLIIHNNRITYYDDLQVQLDRMEESFSYEIPFGTEVICDKAFSKCEKLYSIKVPESVRAIGIRTFQGCKTMQEFYFPSKVIEVKDYCFIACKELRFVTFPNGLLSIGKSSFCGCENLVKIQFPDSLLIIDDSAFLGCPLTEISLTNNIIEIGCRAFYDAKIKSLFIPKSVKHIGNAAFGNCEKLLEVEFLGADIEIDDSIFEKNSLKKIVVPQGSLSQFKTKLPSYEDIIFERINE